MTSTTKKSDEQLAPVLSRRQMLAAATVCGSGVIGCDTKPEVTNTEGETRQRADVPLRVVWVGSQSDADKVQRVWRNLNELPLDIRLVELGDQQLDGKLSETVREARAAAERCDVVVAPLLMMADLFADGTVSEIMGSVFEDDRGKNLLPGLRVGAAGYAGKKMAVPVGCRPWAMLGNEQLDGLVDVLSWNDYDDLVADQNGKAAEPTTRGSCGYAFLLRALSAVPQGWLFDRETFAPTINRVEYVESLELMKRTVARYQTQPMSPDEVGLGIANGDLRFGIGTIDVGSTETASLVAVTDLPRGIQVPEADESADGDPVTLKSRALTPLLLPPMTALGMVSKNCRQTRSAKRWLAWLHAGDGMADVWRSSRILGPTTRSDVGEGSAAITEGAYQDWVEQHFERSTVRPATQLIDGARYYEVLDEAIHKCLRGDQASGDCLANVAKQWGELNESIGIEKQKRAWRRASGREV